MSSWGHRVRLWHRQCHSAGDSLVMAACVLLPENSLPLLSACTVDYMLSGFPQKGKGRSEERCLLVWTRKENKVGGEDAVIHLIQVLAYSALYPLQNRQEEGAGPGIPLAGLLMHSGILSRGFPAFLADGKHFWHSLHGHCWTEPDAQIARGNLIFRSGVVFITQWVGQQENSVCGQQPRCAGKESRANIWEICALTQLLRARAGTYLEVQWGSSPKSFIKLAEIFVILS